MKALVYTEYGSADVLQFKSVEKPTPGDNQVLVKIHAVSLNAADWRLMRADPFLVRLMSGGLFKPKSQILGSDIAGTVEAVGRNVTQLKPGDEVFGDLSGCGLGGLAEYVAAPESVLALKPPSLSFEEAAAAPMAGVTALQGLRDIGNVQPGQKVLINGASGGVGSFAVQIAKAFGAEVTAVCSTRKLDAARSLGADHVIDYTRQDFTQNGLRYDLILAANGYQPLAAYKRALNPDGRYVMAGGSGRQLFEGLVLAPFLSMRGKKKLSALSAKPNVDDLSLVGQWMAAGKVRAVVDRCYPLSEAPDAFRYIEAGHAHGKVVIEVAAANRD